MGHEGEIAVPEINLADTGVEWLSKRVIPDAFLAIDVPRCAMGGRRTRVGRAVAQVVVFLQGARGGCTAQCDRTRERPGRRARWGVNLFFIVWESFDSFCRRGERVRERDESWLGG